MEQQPEQKRLNKLLALNLGISRREADNLISSGRVQINQKTASLGARVLPNDVIKVDGKQIAQNSTNFQYLLLNKPTGYVCSRRQQGETPTIYSLLPAKYHDLKTVGRLDKDSSGLILLTNDGDFTYKMTHPSFYKTKIYRVEIDHALEPLHQQMISDYGLKLPDGISKLLLEKINDSRTEWIITMHEGRNRQIRRTFSVLGYEVVKLHRTNFGNYALGDIKPGEFKLTEKS